MGTYALTMLLLLQFGMAGVDAGPIGENCPTTVGAECPANAECVNGVCKCKCFYTPDNKNAICEARKLTSPCDDTYQCLHDVANSVCALANPGETAKQCDCASGYIKTSGDMCTPRKIDEACDTTKQTSCVIQNSFCDPKTKQCACNPPFIADTDKANCVLPDYNSTCSQDCLCSITVKNSQCLNGTCQCLSGYKYNETEKNCASRGIDDKCKVPDDCKFVTHGECTGSKDDEKCDCQTGYKQNGTDKFSCIARKLNDTCTIETDCKEVKFSNCTDTASVKTCQCSTGYKANSALDTCTARKIKDTCKDNDDCKLVTNCHCTGAVNATTCECKTGYKQNGDLNACSRGTSIMISTSWQALTAVLVVWQLFRAK